MGNKPNIVANGDAPTPGPGLLTLIEAAEYLHVKPRFIRRMIEQRRVPFYKVGGYHIRLRREDLDAMIAASRIDAQR